MKFGYPDATLYSDRSLCCLRQGDGEEALSDAQACIGMLPNWAIGYYRQGMAFTLLKVIWRELDSEVHIQSSLLWSYILGVGLILNCVN